MEELINEFAVDLNIDVVRGFLSQKNPNLNFLKLLQQSKKFAKSISLDTNCSISGYILGDKYKDIFQITFRSKSTWNEVGGKIVTLVEHLSKIDDLVVFENDKENTKFVINGEYYTFDEVIMLMNTENDVAVTVLLKIEFLGLESMHINQ